MKVEIGYLSKSYYMNNQPDAGGYFPFVLEGNTSFIVDFGGVDLYDQLEGFLKIWMNKLKALPIYFCVEIYEFDREDFENHCRSLHISYEYLMENDQSLICLSKIETEKQLQTMLPFLIGVGLTMNNLVLWAIHKNVFRLEKREWIGNLRGFVQETVIVNMASDTTVFWLGYDGDSINAISNQPDFQTYKKVVETLPDFVEPRFIEFSE
ncbi:MAG: hypothetical protein KBT36_02195 [Kurthia sp.]|nr:hypothetical protein [Candidatus Kurthia equi]